MKVSNANLAARIAADEGSLWLASASDAELAEATDAKCREMGIAMDTHVVITCLKAIRAYQECLRNPNK